jgi:hypothetical protein
MSDFSTAIRPSNSPTPQDETARLEDEYRAYALEIERGARELNRHEKIRVDQWLTKLSMGFTNPVFRKNRNLYAKLLYDMVLKKELQDPFKSVPPDGVLPKLSSSSTQVSV